MAKAKPKKEPNPTAKYLARLMRDARAGKIIGFAAVVVHDGSPYATESWYLPPNEFPVRLAGEVHMLNQHVAWEVGGPNHRTDNPPSVPKRINQADAYRESVTAELRAMRRKRKTR